ncbi:MAG: hypothetical protein ACXIUO_02980 [Erythrobacter sp.]
MSDLRVPLSRSASIAAVLRRVWPLMLGLAVAGLVIAWIDGGERPLRPISEAIELPTVGRDGLS